MSAIPPIMLDQALSIHEQFLDSADWNTLPGDIVSVAGEADGALIRLFEIEVLERQPQAMCASWLTLKQSMPLH